jgi:hypothetical protein
VLDVPSAFVAALPDSFDRQGPSVAVWLARDYGLTFDFARLDRLPFGAQGRRVAATNVERWAARL